MNQQKVTVVNSQTSAANTAQTAGLPGVSVGSGSQQFLVALAISASGAGSASVLIQDSSGTLLNLGTVALTAEAKVFTFGLGLPARRSEQLSVQVGAAGVGITTTVSLAGYVI